MSEFSGPSPEEIGITVKPEVSSTIEAGDVLEDASREDFERKFLPHELSKEEVAEIAGETDIPEETVAAAFDILMSKDCALDVDSKDGALEIIKKVSEFSNGKERLEELIQRSNKYAQALLYEIQLKTHIRSADLASLYIDKDGGEHVFDNLPNEKGVLHLSPRVYSVLARINKNGINMDGADSDPYDKGLYNALARIEATSTWHQIGSIKEDLESASNYEEYLNDQTRRTEHGQALASLLELSFNLLKE